MFASNYGEKWIGRRIVLIEDSYQWKSGECGTVIRIDPDDTEAPLFIEFDRSVDGVENDWPTIQRMRPVGAVYESENILVMKDTGPHELYFRGGPMTPEVQEELAAVMLYIQMQEAGEDGD